LQSYLTRTLRQDIFFSPLFYPSASDKYVFVVKGVDDLVGEGKVNAKIKKAETKITVKKFNEKYGTTKSVEIVVVNKKTNQPLYGIPVTFKVTNSTGGEVGYSTSNGTKINVLYTNQNGTISLPMANFDSCTNTLSKHPLMTVTAFPNHP
jgi:hypothetical protein